MSILSLISYLQTWLAVFMDTKSRWLKMISNRSKSLQTLRTLLTGAEAMISVNTNILTGSRENCLVRKQQQSTTGPLILPLWLYLSIIKTTGMRLKRSLKLSASCYSSRSILSLWARSTSCRSCKSIHSRRTLGQSSRCYGCCWRLRGRSWGSILSSETFRHSES